MDATSASRKPDEGKDDENVPEDDLDSKPAARGNLKPAPASVVDSSSASNQPEEGKK